MRLNIATLTAGAILIVLAMRSTASQSDSQATASMVSTIATSSPATATLADAKKISIRDAAILGIVEGVTEYLPVSSTGHLILVSNWLGYDGSSGATEKDAVDSFEIVIQLGAILAVVALYRRRVGQMIGGLAGRNRNGLRLIGLLLIAFTPAAVIGLLFHKTIKQYLFGPNPVCIALLIGGILMILIERWHRRRSTGKRENGIDDMSYRQALFIGLMQCLAMWPGTSRSMVTILAALLVGTNMLAAAEFSFLLALPTLGAATIYDGAKNWHALIECAGPVSLAVGMIVSCLVAAMAVKLFVKWLTSHGLTPFGVYRIILAGIVFWHLSGWKI